MGRTAAVMRTSAMLTLCGAIAGFGTSQMLPHRYVGEGSLKITDRSSVARAADIALSNAFLGTYVAQSPYYLQVLNYTPMAEIVDGIRKNTVIAAQGSNSCMIRFEDDDRYAALETTQVMVDELRRKLTGASVVRPVEVGVTGPTPAFCALVGSAAGLLVSLIPAVLSMGRSGWS